MLKYFDKLKHFVSRYQKELTWASVGLFTVVFFIHWYYVGLYAVNTPYGDEWPVMFSANREAKPFTWQWVFEFNNEHRTVPTKLEVWANYLLFNVNFAYQVIFNFILYGITIIGTIKVLRFSGMSLLFTMAFLIFALSDADKNNFHWAIQSQWHCFFFGFIWGVYFLFRKAEASKRLLLFSLLCFVVSSWSFASGLILSFVAIFLYLLHNGYRQYRELNYTSWKRIAFILLLPFAISTALWFKDFVSPAAHPSYVWPWQSRFWSFLNAELSWIFGIDWRSDAWSAVALFAVAAAFAKLTLDYLKKPSNKLAMLLAFSLGLLACLCSISMGRGQMGIELAKESRYYSIAILLLPAVAWGLYRFKKIGNGLVFLTFAFCVYGHANNWNYKRSYKRIATLMVKGINCIHEFPDSQLTSCSHPLFAGDLQVIWNYAKEKKLSFTTQNFPLPLPE